MQKEGGRLSEASPITGHKIATHYSKAQLRLLYFLKMKGGDVQILKDL